MKRPTTAPAPARKPKVAGHNRTRVDVSRTRDDTSRTPDDTSRTPDDAATPVAAAAVEQETAEHEAPGEPEAAREPGTLDEPEPSGEPEELAEPAADRARWLPVLPLAVLAALLGVGVVFLLLPEPSGVDTRGMTEVSGQVEDGLEKIFSFSYDKVDATGEAARQVLTGPAVGEYEKLIEQVKAQAPAQKLVLATKVTTAGVRVLDGDRAELLVFLDQVATRADTGKTNGSAAALTVRAERHDGSWRIVELVPR